MLHGSKPFTRAQIERLLKPRSIAIVGASDKPGALGGTLLSNLQRNRFSGVIYPINPKRDEIAGLACLKSPAELPEGVDCAVLAVPKPLVLDTVRQLAARKVGSVVIFSAGFAEGGEEGLAQQREIAQIASENAMVIEGPNCLGCRSEEHTSELQSLMRNSYAVFSLTKKKKQTRRQTHT